jgi:hypothetical protein
VPARPSARVDPAQQGSNRCIAVPVVGQIIPLAGVVLSGEPLRGRSTQTVPEGWTHSFGSPGHVNARGPLFLSVDATFKPYGGKWLALDAEAEVLEGAWPGSVVLMEFPGFRSAISTRLAARSWCVTARVENGERSAWMSGDGSS